ncbi:unnamed protein product [Miscanthus lutarioriparius]|uniref:Uncharacterized protein n=1 Tax=Miscanthus lutarioriparius TaxID=422564 RepID=A0A811RA15_9POAL|nr:unnamed protein product [Miscanthus lutarioriparius]
MAPLLALVVALALISACLVFFTSPAVQELGRRPLSLAQQWCKPGQRADPAGPWSGWSIESVAARTSSPIFLGLILLMNSPLSIDVQGVGKNRQAGAQLAHPDGS